jgi:hypothetical protein
VSALILSCIGPNFSNSPDSKALSNTMRDAYFTEFATDDTTGPYGRKYNLNDKRFWNSDIWREVQEERNRKERFEKLKANNLKMYTNPKNRFNY